MNRSKDLAFLFRSSLIKKNEEKEKKIDIYFYEWSNISTTPLHYFRVETFEEFLKRSGITLETYQRGIIARLGTVFVSCYKGTKTLVIRSTWKGLKSAMDEFLNGDTSPSSGSVIQRPTAYNDYDDYELYDSRYPYNGNGVFFCT